MALSGTVTSACEKCGGRVINRVNAGSVVLGYTCVEQDCGFATVPAYTVAQLVEMGKF